MKTGDQESNGGNVEIILCLNGIVRCVTKFGRGALSRAHISHRELMSGHQQKYMCKQKNICTPTLTKKC